MNKEYKNLVLGCQNCTKDFTIEPDDFSFYEKIKVPPPTFCPECRIIRRMIWRNCRSLFKRTCSNCEKSIISMYSPKRTAIVYCIDCWNSDDRDPFKEGRDYDFSKTFFEQLDQLRKDSPLLFVHHTGSVIRSEYTNYSGYNKDCYLSYSVIYGENIMYSEVIDYSKNSLDNYAVSKIENCSYNLDCEGNYNNHYAIRSRNCIDCLFVFDCVNCQNCYMSYNLRNKNYVFGNKQYTKEEYQKKIEELNLGSFSNFEKIKEEFDFLIKNKAIHKYAQIYNSQGVLGDYIGNSKNVHYSFDVLNSENIKYSTRVLALAKDSYDNQGLAQGELIYESVATSFGSYKDFFTYICVGSKECQYSLMCKNCSNCFGCVGLVNSSYCIFNKQYKKEEYFEIVERIKSHMDEIPYVDQKGRVYKYGEFFPYDLSPFGYNETNAHDFFPIKREIAIEKGYPWKDKEEKNYDTTIDSFDLPDDIKDVDENILKQIISCPNNGNEDYMCSTAYKIVKEELSFYKQKNFPLPRYCPNCRHYQRLKYRNPLKLWPRTCMKENCNNKFQTSYSPDRQEIIYCEQCYQQEVY
jgi:hypothetical protein